MFSRKVVFYSKSVFCMSTGVKARREQVGAS